MFVTVHFLTTYQWVISTEMKVKFDEMTSTPSTSRCKDPVQVERRLNKVCKKLNITEVNIGLFHRMVKNGVVTNDVRSFTVNQQKLKKSISKPSKAMYEAAMKQKLKDACSMHVVCM